MTWPRFGFRSFIALKLCRNYLYDKVDGIKITRNHIRKQKLKEIMSLVEVVFSYILNIWFCLKLPCSNRDLRCLIIFRATPRFSEAGLVTDLYDLEFFNWNCLKASMASFAGSIDPLLEVVPDLNIDDDFLLMQYTLGPGCQLARTVGFASIVIIFEVAHWASSLNLAWSQGGLSSSKTGWSWFLHALLLCDQLAWQNTSSPSSIIVQGRVKLFNWAG